MTTKKGVSPFPYSEPEFLISTMDRHRDWAVVICLVGGGQEINTGEAGMPEGFDSLRRALGLHKGIILLSRPSRNFPWRFSSS